MKFLIKLFLYILVSVLFLFLVFSTFLAPQYEKIKALAININFDKFIKINNNVLLEKFSQLDSIYYSKSGIYTKKTKNNNISIELGKGRFIFNLNDLTKKYKIIHKGFIITPLGTGIFYLDTRNKTKINIISKENFLKIGFQDLKSGKIINTAFLYPHEYIIINTLRNKSIKNADFIRVKSQVFTSGYISDKISDSNIASSKVGKIIGEKSINFLNTSLKNINKKYKDNFILYNKIQKISSWSFPLINYIEKNISYFYNDSKKIIYYKNNIIKNTLILFKKNNIKTYLIRDNIKVNLNKLKNIDKTEYKKMLNFIKYIYNITLINNSLSISGILDINNNFSINDININRKVNFYNLKLEINNRQRTILYPSLIYLKSTFNLFDLGKIDDLNKNLNNFIILFYKDLNIQNKNGILIYKSKYKNTNQIDYLGFYLKNYISYAFLKNTGIKNSLKLINNYIILNENIYFKSIDKDRIKTGIYEGLIFLKKLNSFIRNKLFIKKRNNRGLLVKKYNNDSNITYIKILDKNIKKINTNIENNLSLVENTKLFNDNKNNFKEYFGALLDYELYVLNYDKIKNGILNVKTIGFKNNSIKITKQNFIKYIKQFSGINNNSINNIKINIINNIYYQIKNIYINGKSMSFNLYPYEGNKLDKIIINGIDENKQLYYNSTYYLDKQQKILKETAKNINGINKDKYDFKMFFLNKFFKKNDIIYNDTTIGKNQIKLLNEDKIVIIFKTNKLLGKTGEFNMIKRFIDIKYSNLLVIRKGNIYNIIINGSLISIKQKENNSKYGLLYGKYILNSTSHYFDNVNIKFYSEYKKNKIFGISGNKIHLLGKINLLDLEKTIKTFFSNTENIKYVYNSIYSNYINIEKLKINYDTISRQIIFNFKINNNYIEISFKGSNIINISYNGIKIIGNDSLNNLTNILLKINN